MSIYDMNTACAYEGVNGVDLSFVAQFFASTGYIFCIFRSTDVP
jgi:hypothetical protein